MLDSYRGVPVYDNGLLYFRNHGKNYSKDGYYFGQKWQCVEFVKRFYYQAKNHRMPDVMGHAKSFFDFSPCARRLVAIISDHKPPSQYQRFSELSHLTASCHFLISPLLSRIS